MSSGLLAAFLICIPMSVYSQQEFSAVKDTADYTRTVNLPELVVTGQYEPQSAQNSIFRVKVIDRANIQAHGAATLNEALSNELNVRLSQDLAIGSASLSLQGISGNNVKLLLDGIPVVGRNGNGADVDLYQIDLNQVKRIEIVEGPMAVNYGANALAGVINIVTDKNSEYKTAVTASVTEETAGAEYGLTSGRHVQNLFVKHNFSQKWYARFNVSRNDFRGYQGRFTGRQKEWNPRRQWFLSGSGRFNFHERHKITYSVNYLDENILNAGQTRYAITETGKKTPYAFDEEYQTRRLDHRLQGDGKLDGLRYNFIFSYADFKRKKSKYSHNLVTGSKTFTRAEGDQDTSFFTAFALRGSLVKTFGSYLSLQAGYDINIETSGGDRISGNDRSVQDYGFFATSEWTPLRWLKVRPGLRYALNSVYDTPLLPSLNLKLGLNDKTELRLAYGRGYRAPTIRELYFEFVDSNHRIFGNDELEPEYSHHVSGILSKRFSVDAIDFTASAGGFFNDIDNLITISQSAVDVTAASYVNIHRYKTVGFVFEQQFSAKRISGKTGFSYTGRYNRLSESDTLSLKSFFYSPEINASLTYQFPKAGLDINLFYKYNGKIKSYRDAAEGEGFETGIQDSYHWMDANISWKTGEHFTLQAGAKNLLDVTKINARSGGGAHMAGNSLPVSYGRSYFFKATYNLNIN